MDSSDRMGPFMWRHRLRSKFALAADYCMALNVLGIRDDRYATETALQSAPMGLVASCCQLVAFNSLHQQRFRSSVLLRFRRSRRGPVVAPFLSALRAVSSALKRVRQYQDRFDPLWIRCEEDSDQHQKSTNWVCTALADKPVGSDRDREMTIELQYIRFNRL